ncbi:DUF1003 domain-containing protein [Paracoccus marcusii]|uniref:DUF1003 domain-containing protein n=1 Tax=Paracoccus marcusii TaxID=59779 RepID=UPI0031F1918D
MMGQRRQETQNRLRGKTEYRINLKAELEIRQLHEKIDHQLARQWQRLVEMQQIGEPANGMRHADVISLGDQVGAGFLINA